jgi:hypothetical protein
VCTKYQQESSTLQSTIYYNGEISSAVKASHAKKISKLEIWTLILPPASTIGNNKTLKSYCWTSLQMIFSERQFSCVASNGKGNEHYFFGLTYAVRSNETLSSEEAVVVVEQLEIFMKRI